MHLSLFHDKPSSAGLALSFEKDSIYEKLLSIDRLARRKGLEALDPKRNLLVSIGCEVNGRGEVTKNSYGVLNLAWRALEDGDWAGRVRIELAQIRSAIKEKHGTNLKYVIWAGMGGSAEDKAMYEGCGLMKGGPRLYVLDSTDPAKLKNIIEDMTGRLEGSIENALRSTLVVGMAMGMTSYEPVLNLEKLAALYERFRIDSAANFIYMTVPGSILDQFASKRGYRRVELQLDDGNSTAGRHSGPLTRGSLYPLGLSRTDLDAWIAGTNLSREEITTAWRVASFLHAQGAAGRDKVTLLLPKEWSAAALWTKQDFEESLGKSEEIGIKIFIGEKIRMSNYRSPKDPLQDRVFLALQFKGATNAEAQKLRRAGYPVAVLTLPANSALSRYMQFIHYAVFGLGYLRQMNFVTQPSVELYKAITGRIVAQAEKAGGIERSDAWLAMKNTRRQAKWDGGVVLRYDRAVLTLDDFDEADRLSAPQIYVRILSELAHSRKIGYGELTFFGDLRYSSAGRALRKVLDRAAESLFRSRMKMPVDVYEGPAMNHSYHEMVIGHGKCLSTVLLSEKAERIPMAGYSAEYHRAQFLATQLALAERGRPVVSLTLRDLEEPSLRALDRFFHECALAARKLR